MAQNSLTFQASTPHSLIYTWVHGCLCTPSSVFCCTNTLAHRAMEGWEACVRSTPFLCMRTEGEREKMVASVPSCSRGCSLHPSRTRLRRLLSSSALVFPVTNDQHHALRCSSFRVRRAVPDHCACRSPPLFPLILSTFHFALLSYFLSTRVLSLCATDVYTQ